MRALQARSDGAAATLSDDVLVEIVTRMPLKSFSRSKCVSKSWQALLSDDYVRARLPPVVSGVLQPSLKNNGPVYVSAPDGSRLEPARLDSFPFAAGSTLIDCCNGLLLFYSSSAASFHVCNPTTMKHASLPRPSVQTKLAVLAFDPAHSRHFKVVSFTGWRGRSADLEVFCSLSGGWAARKVDWGTDTNDMSATMRYMGGVLYILVQPNRVAAVDLDDMTCGLVELPAAVGRECCIARVGGRLHYSTTDGNNRLRIWAQLGDERWVLKHCVSIGVAEFRVMALDPERDGVVYLCVKGRLVAYDVREGRVEGSWEMGEESRGHLIQAWVFPFSKNLENCLAD